MTNIAVFSDFSRWPMERQTSDHLLGFALTYQQ